MYPSTRLCVASHPSRFSSELVRSTCPPPPLHYDNGQEENKFELAEIQSEASGARMDAKFCPYDPNIVSFVRYSNLFLFLSAHATHRFSRRAVHDGYSANRNYSSHNRDGDMWLVNRGTHQEKRLTYSRTSTLIFLYGQSRERA